MVPTKGPSSLSSNHFRRRLGLWRACRLVAIKFESAGITVPWSLDFVASDLRWGGSYERERSMSGLISLMANFLSRRTRPPPFGLQ
jgi:hypothetical protein